MADGRRLAYAEWGDPDGKPLFLFHGAPFSRLFCPDEPATLAAGVRLITVDRPGIGRSDVLEARSWGDWPADVVALAGALGIDRFAVVGWSYGGNYAAACAALIPSRVTAAGVVSTRHLSEYNVVERPDAYAELDPEDRTDYDLAQKDPLAAAENWARRNADWVANVRENPESYIDRPRYPKATSGSSPTKPAREVFLLRCPKACVRARTDIAGRRLTLGFRGASAWTGFRCGSIYGMASKTRVSLDRTLTSAPAGSLTLSSASGPTRDTGAA